MLRHRLRLFDAVVSPTMDYASGTWTFTKEHERMIQSAQRKTFDSSYKRKRETKRSGNETTRPTKTTRIALKMKMRTDKAITHTTIRTATSLSRTIPMMKLTQQRLEEKNVKRSTDEAIEKMENAKIRCWIKTHERMKKRLALRIASLPSERWIVKAAKGNPELSSRYKTYRAIGRPRRRWEDDINEFLKLKENETENSTENDNKYNKSWIKAAKRPWKMDST